MPNARLLLLIVAVAFLVTVVQLGLLQVTFHKLGLAAESASLLLMVTLLGSMINLPLFTVPTDPAAQEKRLHELPRLLLRRMQVIPGKTLIAVNVGGCVVPLAFSLYLFDFSQPGPFVLRSYHGTTNTFEEFNASLKGNMEGQFGAVNYFTSSESDARDNYAGEGPENSA